MIKACARRRDSNVSVDPLGRRRPDAAFDLHSGRGAESLQNDAASLCRVEQGIQVFLWQVICSLKFNVHLSALKADRNVFASHQCAAYIGTKADVNLQVLQFQPLEVSDHADSRIKATCQRRSQQFARAGEVTFAADGPVHRNWYVHRYPFAADDMRMNWMGRGDLRIRGARLINHPSRLGRLAILPAQGHLSIKHAKRRGGGERLNVREVSGVQCHSAAPAQCREQTREPRSGSVVWPER